MKSKTAKAAKTKRAQTKATKTVKATKRVKVTVPTAAGPRKVVESKTLEEMNLLEKVDYLARQVLDKAKATSTEKALSGKDVYAKAMAAFPKEKSLAVNTFQQYLSKLVRERSSSINCQGRKQGYYLSQAAKDLLGEGVDPGVADEEPAEAKRREKERLLYPVLLNWLIEQDYRAAITSTGRANGWWGNPDIAGIICDQAFGGFTLEVATIEVKLSEKGWRQWVFEAVSHRRFANRSYFAIAHPAELIKKLDTELRYFSELYKIGVIVVAMDKKQFDDLQAGRLTKPILDHEVDIVELYSAPFSQVQPRYQQEYLQGLKIKSIPEVARWGRGLEDDETA